MATIKKLARARTRSKARQQKAPKAAEKGTSPVEALRNEFQLTGAAFDGCERLRKDCTAADLFSLVFAGNNAGDEFIEGVLGCLADDFELIEGAACGDMPCDQVIARVCQRNAWRIKVALRVSELMQQAEVSL